MKIFTKKNYNGYFYILIIISYVQTGLNKIKKLIEKIENNQTKFKILIIRNKKK
ncbi:hypothetical protein Abm4_1104 [Methanobrevibacter sp. AbM4]|nr:hypothetical protein Abm4_1104 [Methanobrevibacter sp. AbM4]